MATLNLSTNGPSISKSYQSIINSAAPTGIASKSATYAQWAVFSVTAPLVNAFQKESSGKESVLKVQSTGGAHLKFTGDPQRAVSLTAVDRGRTG